MDDEELARTIANQQLQQQMGANAMTTQQQLLLQEQEKGLAEEQLDVEEIIERINNLLHGREFKEISPGVKGWVDSKEDRMKTLSDWGIQRIMQTVRFHINKNTLLSNFNEEQINRMMYHFTTELNDLVLLKYQKLFRKISFDDCKKIVKERIKEREEIKSFAFELLGEAPNPEEIKKELVLELEGRMEYEIKKIKDDELKERIKEYGLLLWEIESAVYATLNRAYGGKERDTLRKHASFSEIRTLQPEPQKKGGLFGWTRG